MFLIITKRRSKTVPYKIKERGKKTYIYNQHNFKSAFVKHHGCSIVACQTALKWCGSSRSFGSTYKYIKKHAGHYKKAKYTIKGMAHVINAIMPGSPAIYHKTYSSAKIRQALKNGKLVLFEEGSPCIHTVVLLYDFEKHRTMRLSDGKITKTTVAKEMSRRCKNSRYAGWVSVK